MVKVEVVSDFFVEATRSHYLTGWKGEVSKVLFERHGPEGTKFLKRLDKKAVLTKDEIPDPDKESKNA